MSKHSPSPIRSMTGYASARAPMAGAEINISLRSVNHRGLDLHFHQNGELARFEPAMRETLKRGLTRGHVEVRAFVARDESAAQLPGISGPALDHYLQALHEASARHQVPFEPAIETLLALPGVLLRDVTMQAEPDAEWEPAIITALSDCIRELNACREREGEALRSYTLSELGQLEQDTAAVASIRANALALFHERLHTRLRELLSEASISDTRLAEEAALQADRSDIQEEITRLEVHAAELRRIVEGGGEVGKRIDFLLQEMNRECNTVLSKTSGIGDAGLTITSLGLSIKARLEKIREQASNLE